jgi:hypothetical protein
LAIQGGDEEGGGGSDIGALLGNLGPLIGSLSGVSLYKCNNNIIKIYVHNPITFPANNHFGHTGWR